ncbi:MAG: ECF transporter S component [Candidatus Odinarchaeia archaeon]
MHSTIKITLTALLGALGIVLRTMAFPIISNVQLTPGMIAPILSGMLLGLWPGITTGFIIGIYAALFSGEFWVIPLIGNICLGLGAGLVNYFIRDEQKFIKSSLFLCSSAVIGGFLPTFTVILAFLPETVAVAAISGLFDLVNALIAAIVALIIREILITKFSIFNNST